MNEVGIGTRVVNFLVDVVLIFFLSYLIYKWYMFYVHYYYYYPIQFYWFFYAMVFVYYSIFEVIFSRSPAKWITKTKVCNMAGKRPAFYQVLFRSLLRLTLIDPFFIPMFGKPLHDLLSKTKVVEV